MNIQFNEVTWYSKVAAAFVFIIAIPALSFYLGKEYGEVKALVDSPAYVSDEPQKITIVSTPVSTSNDNLKYFKSPESNNQSFPQYGNIVGYFAHGNFFFYVPGWIPEYWDIENLPNGGMNFSLNQPIANKDFSDIAISLATTTEKINAETLYSSFQSNIEPLICISGSRCEVRGKGSSIITSEVFLSRVGDTRIYHVAELSSNGMVIDHFYIDGKNVTADITFSAHKDSYGVYAAPVREFVQGIGKGEGAQG